MTFGGSYPGAMYPGGGSFIPPYHVELLALAQQLKAENRNEMAVIAAAMACELVGERIINTWLLRRNVGELRKPLEGFVQSFNLANDRLRKVYHGLSGDDITIQAFWHDFKKLVEKRNGIIHGGERIDDVTADTLLGAGNQFIRYISDRL